MNFSACSLRLIVSQFLFLSLFSSVLLGQGGTVHNRSLVQDGILRSYLLYVPAAYDGQEAWSLVINYHGFLSNATDQMNSFSKMNPVADTAHFLVAYPRGLQVEDLVPNLGFPSMGPGWVIPGTWKGDQDDVAFTDSLIDEVQKDFNIDSSRIHITGWSNGSEMAFWAGFKLHHRIASVAGVAGPMSYVLRDSVTITRPFSVLSIHGTSDPIAPFNGTPDIIPSAPTAASFWANYNKCSLDSIVTEVPDLDPSDGSTVTLIEYVGCDNSEVLFYRVNNGGHGWPGGISGGIIGATNQDINASAEVLSFFRRNPMPDVDTPPTSVQSINNNSLKTFKLYANYPNPFNPSTIINYSLASPFQVELKIYNTLGRGIRTLVNSMQPVGSHEVSWDGRDNGGDVVASGTYFYQLRTESVVETRKMLFIQ